jgi:hypothetical protein
MLKAALRRVATLSDPTDVEVGYGMCNKGAELPASHRIVFCSVRAKVGYRSINIQAGTSRRALIA